jgi:hypothetical protein
MTFWSQMQIDHGGFEAGVSQVALDEAEVDAGFEEMGGIRMSARIATLLIARQYFRSVTPTTPFADRRLNWSEGFASSPQTVS